MKEYVLYATDGTPITLSQKRYLIAKKYIWHVTLNGHGKKMLITYLLRATEALNTQSSFIKRKLSYLGRYQLKSVMYPK